ncbi:helix-turn-helix domain-containing protein [Paenibacillus rhizoplanae]
MAAMIGTTAETLSRKLNKLEALKIIAMHKKNSEYSGDGGTNSARRNQQLTI